MKLIILLSLLLSASSYASLSPPNAVKSVVPLVLVLDVDLDCDLDPKTKALSNCEIVGYYYGHF